MRTTPFAEYRCPCERLLLKGLVLSSHVEVKCKRCGAIKDFGPADADDETTRYGFITDKNGRITQVSDSMPEVLGYSREELCSMHMNELAADTEADVPAARIVPTGDTGVSYDTSHRTATGEVQAVHARACRLTGSREHAFVYLFERASGTESDVHEADTDTFGTAIHAHMIGADMQGIITSVNIAACEFLEKEASTLLGSPFFAFIHPAARAAYEKQYKEMAQRRVAFSLRVPFAHEVMEANIMHVPAFDDIGRMCGYSLVLEFVRS